MNAWYLFITILLLHEQLPGSLNGSGQPAGRPETDTCPSVHYYYRTNFHNLYLHFF